ncbi:MULTISPECIES: hypothetical protein [unclassified Mesorhizobium]|uniref:hypothetical protein n=1 Tax=unclassified Mesorhizobium TaxID=325217 RepID=UPI00112C1D65|nr:MULTISPECIES: hypothetical protein [unclassified Mesorhizobium]MCA0027358.1 hypothetical protein [Mesorhizobium sp. B263B1A]TPJ98632.1 hypothetical protein FJ489_06810 [Mesorhizobium sp. B2-5-12]TPK28795.1 hypothetical protein FJ562_00200 [Mesorhizobium sp. B2-5-6]
MTLLSKAGRTGPGFGNPDAIDPARLFRLPLAMQAEGVRLLFEMGQNLDQVKARVGLSRKAIEQLLQVEKPFRRGGDVNVAAEGV